MSDNQRMGDYLRRIAVGPRASRDLTRAEARDGLEIVLRGETSEVRAGLFLVALRLKLESDDEYLGLLDALRAFSRIETSLAPLVLDIADPYDGYLRAPKFGPFVAAVLSALGAGTVLHGADGIPPKQGCTHRGVIEALGGAVDRDPGAVAERVAGGEWGYLDLASFCPALAALTPLRREIVKRPALALLEKLVAPIRGSERTLLVTGYVHSAYAEKLPRVLRGGPHSEALLIRGAEGATDLSIKRPTVALRVDDKGDVSELNLDPAVAGVAPLDGPDWERVTPQGVAAAGLEALAGQVGSAYEQIVWTAGAFAHFAGLATSSREGVELARQALDSGRAQNCLKRSL